MKTVIAAGGELPVSFLKQYLAFNPYDRIIAADRGLDALAACGIIPDRIVGDYDSTQITSFDLYRKNGVPIEVYPCEKDYSDTESAVRRAVTDGSTDIAVLGGGGGRMDHFLANVLDLRIAAEAGVSARLVDEQNIIFVASGTFEIFVRSGTVTCTAPDGRGKWSCRVPGPEWKYFGLVPLGEKISGVTLSGFKYEMRGGLLSQSAASFGISNEFTESAGRVILGGAFAAAVVSRDRK